MLISSSTISQKFFSTLKKSVKTGACYFRCLGYQRYSDMKSAHLPCMDHRSIFNQSSHETDILTVIHSLFFCPHPLFLATIRFLEIIFLVSLFPQHLNNCCMSHSDIYLISILLVELPAN